MRKTAFIESVALVKRVVSDLLGTVPSQVGSQAGAQLRYDTENLTLYAAREITQNTLAESLQKCFVDAVAAGATFDLMVQYAIQLTQLPTSSDQANGIQQFSIINAIIQCSAIIETTTYTNREQVDQVLTAMSGVFAGAIETVADEGTTDVFLSLINLQAAIQGYLINTQQPLPDIVKYIIPETMPSFVLAMKLYAKPDKVDILADNLAGQNDAFQPLFMPLEGLALSSP